MKEFLAVLLVIFTAITLTACFSSNKTKPNVIYYSMDTIVVLNSTSDLETIYTDSFNTIIPTGSVYNRLAADVLELAMDANIVLKDTAKANSDNPSFKYSEDKLYDYVDAAAFVYAAVQDGIDTSVLVGNQKFNVERELIMYKASIVQLKSRLKAESNVMGERSGTSVVVHAVGTMANAMRILEKLATGKKFDDPCDINVLNCN